MPHSVELEKHDQSRMITITGNEKTRSSINTTNIIIELERRQILQEAQLISLVGFGEDSVILKDAKKENRLIEVQIRNRRLKCITEDRFDCIHVGFALALPEVRKALDK